MAVQQEAVDRSLVPGIAQPAQVTAPPAPQRLATGFGRIAFLVVLTGLSALFLFPFVWLLSASLKVRSEVFNGDWIPDPIAWENYVKVWQASEMPSWFFNSVLVGVLAAGTVVLSSALVAFGFAYFRFPFRNAVFALVLATMMLPGAVTMVPTFLIWNSVNLTDTLVPLWAGNLFGSAFYIFLLRQFFLGLPRELFEAARVDGASYLQMWWRIALPLTRPALIVVAVFEFKASWTDLIKPLIYLRDAAEFTLPLGLKSLLDRFGQGGEMEWEIVMAASVITAVPMIAIFFVAQRYFVQGIATTGVKG
ncbi:MAG: carbohydrate ABC transporter permease [Chloroflexota bacterium]|nr:carbohydrate ABC transporter permease [Chloroflexota bacterium]